MLEQHDAGFSFAEIGRHAGALGVKNAYGDAPSGAVVASVIRLKLRERASALSAGTGPIIEARAS